MAHLDMYGAEDVWKRVQAAFAVYGKQIRPLRGARREHVLRLLADGYTADDLVAAVHGYVHWHEGLERKSDGFDPSKWFTPEAVFRLEKLEARIEFGARGAWAPKRSRAEERERQRQAEVAALRRQVMEERGLRAV